MPENRWDTEDRPDSLVSPRYLAGSDGDYHPILDPLDQAGWTAFSDEQFTTRHAAPDRRHCVAYYPVDEPATDHSSHPVWHLWGRPRPHGPAEWNALISGACPPEIIGGLTTALAAPSSTIHDLPPDEATKPLSQAGWRTRHHSGYRTFHAPAGHPGHATVVHVYAPGGIEFRADAHTVTWRVTVGCRHGESPLWQADFTARTPPYLVAAFTAALAEEEPLPRFADDIDPAVRPHLRLATPPSDTGH